MPLHRRTKIIATVGPACDSVEMLQKLIVAGVNIFRLNMAHGDLSSHSSRVYRIREAAEASGMPVGILAGLAGPKLRLGRLAVDPLECQAGDELLLTRGKVTTEPNVLVSEYEALLDEIQAGDRIIIGDGTVALEVRSSNSRPNASSSMEERFAAARESLCPTRDSALRPSARRITNMRIGPRSSISITSA